jgi:hypothetical protein
MKKKLKFSVVATWILLTRSYDAYCTHSLTPDLRNEANPLVSIGGITSWTALLVILGALTAYSLYAYSISTFKPTELLPERQGMSFRNFVGYLYLGQEASWMVTLYKLPKDLVRFNNYMGQVLTRSLVFAGVVSTIMWVLINNSELYRSIHSPALIYTILIVGSIAIIYSWNRSMYVRYQSGTGLD